MSNQRSFQELFHKISRKRKVQIYDQVKSKIEASSRADDDLREQTTKDFGRKNFANQPRAAISEVTRYVLTKWPIVTRKLNMQSQFISTERADFIKGSGALE